MDATIVTPVIAAIQRELTSLGAEIAELDAQRAIKADRKAGLEKALEGLQQVMGEAAAASEPSGSPVTSNGRPTYKEAVLRVMAERPNKSWRLTDIRDEALKRGWVAPSNANPLETLRVAANELVKKGNRLRKRGPGLYLYVDESGVRVTLKPREIQPP